MVYCEMESFPENFLSLRFDMYTKLLLTRISPTLVPEGAVALEAYGVNVSSNVKVRHPDELLDADG